MEKDLILLGYDDKQWILVQKLQEQIVNVDLSSYESRYVFALKTQQYYTVIEDLLKQIAKSFENHIQDFSLFHKELLVRLHTAILSIRPRVLSEESFLFLDKIRVFCQFVWQAYNSELQETELQEIQNKLKNCSSVLEKDFLEFRRFVEALV